MRIMQAVSMAVLSSACATTSTPRTNLYAYVEQARTLRSEADVTSCANARAGSHPWGGPGTSASTERQNTAYGPGTVSDYLGFSTARDGTQTVLTVTARSYVFPESGRGELNTNTVTVPVTAEAKARARMLIEDCTG